MPRYDEAQGPGTLVMGDDSHDSHGFEVLTVKTKEPVNGFTLEEVEGYYPWLEKRGRMASRGE